MSSFFKHQLATEWRITRYSVFIWLALQIAMACSHLNLFLEPNDWNQANVFERYAGIGLLVSFVFLSLICFQLFYRDLLSDECAFWKTRPLPQKTLMGAKLLWLHAAFIAPALIIQFIFMCIVAPIGLVLIALFEQFVLLEAVVTIVTTVIFLSKNWQGLIQKTLTFGAILFVGWLAAMGALYLRHPEVFRTTSLPVVCFILLLILVISVGTISVSQAVKKHFLSHKSLIVAIASTACIFPFTPDLIHFMFSEHSPVKTTTLANYNDFSNSSNDSYDLQLNLPELRDGEHIARVIDYKLDSDTPYLKLLPDQHHRPGNGIDASSVPLICSSTNKSFPKQATFTGYICVETYTRTTKLDFAASQPTTYQDKRWNISWHGISKPIRGNTAQSSPLSVKQWRSPLFFEQCTTLGRLNPILINYTTDSKTSKPAQYSSKATHGAFYERCAFLQPNFRDSPKRIQISIPKHSRYIKIPVQLTVKF